MTMVYTVERWLPVSKIYIKEGLFDSLESVEKYYEKYYNGLRIYPSDEFEHVWRGVIKVNGDVLSTYRITEECVIAL